MDQNFASTAVVNLPQCRSSINGHTVLQAILHLQNLNGFSVNNLKNYLANQHGIDCQTLNATIKGIMKIAMGRNILKTLGDTGKVSECKRRRKSSGGKKRRKSGRKGKKSSGKKKSGGKRSRRKSKKAAAEDE